MSVEPRHDLNRQLATQISFLVASSQSFDAGFEDEALRLAVTIRLLMHESGASRSLLGQLRHRDDIVYLDTAPRYSSRNLAPESGLAMARIQFGSAGHGAWVPRLNRPNEDRWLGVRRWWMENAVIRDARRELFSRKDLVLYAANQDGGAHVDPELDARYEALTRRNSLGTKYVSPAGEFDFINGPALASIRMIAHELLFSIQRAIPETLRNVRVLQCASSRDAPDTVWEVLQSGP